MPRVILGDCLDELRKLPDDSVDLVFCSPPYEAARTYGIGFNLRGQDWVDWSVARYLECVRVCRGLVAWVVEGQTRDFRYSAAPLLLGADLHRAGVSLRKPPVFHRVGIPGSGGREWLRNDYEFVVCSTKGKLPWSDNTAMGHAPKWGVGGEMSNRHTDGMRKNSRNQWGHSGTGHANRRPSGIRDFAQRPSHVRDRPLPVKANPGNVIHCNVGGGTMGSRLCHENEAPFPERLAEFFVRSFCQPGGTVLDPFCGSGTTLAVAKMHGRDWIGIDIRQAMINLTMRRLEEVDAKQRATSSTTCESRKKSTSWRLSTGNPQQAYLF